MTVLYNSTLLPGMLLHCLIVCWITSTISILIS